MKLLLVSAWIAASLLASGASSQLGSPPVLRVSEPYPLLGSTFTYTVSGQPGARYSLFGALAPAQVALRSGTLFLDPGGLIRLGRGTLDAAGNASVSITLPSSPPLAGTFLYAQAVQVLASGVELSNAVPAQARALAPAGANTPLSIAATLDGRKLYVAHENGSLTVIDPGTGIRRATLPIGPDAEGIPFRAVDVALGPDGEHAFVTNAAARFLVVIDTATDSVAARVPVPRGSRRTAFDFGATKIVYVTNDRDDTVLRLREDSPGNFTALAPLVLEGHGPGPIVVLPGGKVMVGNHVTFEVEVLDPTLSASTTVARTPLGAIPTDLQLGGSVVLAVGVTGQPANKLFKLSATSFAVTGTHLVNAGTDYLDLALAPPYLALVGGGSGSVVLADATTFAPLATVDLAPGDPASTPQQAAFVLGAGGVPTQLWTADYFRESARAVELVGGPPFGLGVEVALAYSGAPRIPLVDLTQEENGDWFFRSVQFFHGTPSTPNPVTCYSCHPDGASDGLPHGRQAPAFFAAGATAPYGWNGSGATLSGLVNGAFFSHGIFGGVPSPGSVQMVSDFIAAVEGPPSPFREPDGSLSPAAQAGQLVFEGPASCVQCHAAPDFIPLSPASPTISAGVGTGLAPANVPTLLGLWATAPYLHDGSAATLLEVLDENVSDQHGTTSTLSAQQKTDLIAYLRSL